MLEHHFRHQTGSLECELATRVRELRARDMPPHRELRLAQLERGQHEQVSLLVKPRLADANPVHYAFAKCQLSHCYSFFPPLRGRICRAGIDSSSRVLLP